MLAHTQTCSTLTCSTLCIVASGSVQLPTSPNLLNPSHRSSSGSHDSNRKFKRIMKKRSMDSSWRSRNGWSLGRWGKGQGGKRKQKQHLAWLQFGSLEVVGSTVQKSSFSQGSRGWLYASQLRVGRIAGGVSERTVWTGVDDCVCN